MPNETDGHVVQEAGDDSALLALLDLIGRRWALRVVWELRADRLTYRELAARIPEMSTSVLTQRLRDLRAAHLVEHRHGSGYGLAPNGRDLLAQLESMRTWASRVGFGVRGPDSRERGVSP